MVIVDGSGKIVLINSRTEELFGYPRQELLGDSVEVLLPERFHGRHVRYRQSYVEDPKQRPIGAGLELFGLRKDGSEFPVEISLSPIQTADGLFVSSAIRDLSVQSKGRRQVPLAFGSGARRDGHGGQVGAHHTGQCADRKAIRLRKIGVGG